MTAQQLTWTIDVVKNCKQPDLYVHVFITLAVADSIYRQVHLVSAGQRVGSKREKGSYVFSQGGPRQEAPFHSK